MSSPGLIAETLLTIHLGLPIPSPGFYSESITFVASRAKKW